MGPRKKKRPRVPNPRFPHPPQVVEKQNANRPHGVTKCEPHPTIMSSCSDGENPQIVPKRRLPVIARIIAKKRVSQPRSSPRSKPRSGNQPPPSNRKTSSFVGVAQADSSPTTNNHPSSSQSLSTAKNVGNLNISGGLFLNSPQAVVQVCGGAPCEHQPVKPKEIPQGRDNSLPMPDLKDIENVDAEILSPRQSTQSRGKAEANCQCTIKDCDVYYRQLLLAGRGSPMWIPGPNMLLPMEYRRTGTRIGDIGIIYPSEGFNFLFNIFLEAGDPVNEGRIPDGFEPLDFEQVKRDLEKRSIYGPGHHFASASCSFDSSGLVFETIATEGAILIMPDGATAEDLLNHALVEEYIAKNARSWYTYITKKRGRKVKNGDIRLVIGFDKVASWGIATFGNSVEERVRFEFKTNDSNQAASRAHSWTCVGSGSGRVGPQKEEMDDLRTTRESSAAEFILKNQTVFVRTLNFNLEGEAWDDLATHEIRSSDHSSNDSGSPSDQQPPSSSSGASGQSSTGSSGSHSGQGNVNFQAAQFGLSVVQHPSNKINDLLLKKFPNAQIVITGDAAWISVLTKEDVIFPSPEDLCARLLSSGKIREKDGVVTFYDDHANSDDELFVKPNLNTLRSDDITSATQGLASFTLHNHPRDNIAPSQQQSSLPSDNQRIGVGHSDTSISGNNCTESWSGPFGYNNFNYQPISLWGELDELDFQGVHQHFVHNETIDGRSTTTFPSTITDSGTASTHDHISWESPHETHLMMPELTTIVPWTMEDSAMASTQNGRIGYNSGGSSHEIHLPTTRPVIFEPQSRDPCMQPDILLKRDVASHRVLFASASRRKVEAKFICPVEGCNSSFTRKYNLNNHKNSHFGIRDNFCPTCEKGFTTYTTMKRHYRKCSFKAGSSSEAPMAPHALAQLQKDVRSSLNRS